MSVSCQRLDSDRENGHVQAKFADLQAPSSADFRTGRSCRRLIFSQIRQRPKGGGSAATAESIAKILTAFPNGDHYRASERAFPGLIYFHKTETRRSPRTPEESQKLFAWEHWTVFIPLQHSYPAPT